MENLSFTHTCIKGDSSTQVQIHISKKKKSNTCTHTLVKAPCVIYSPVDRSILVFKPAEAASQHSLIITLIGSGFNEGESLSFFSSNSILPYRLNNSQRHISPCSLNLCFCPAWPYYSYLGFSPEMCQSDRPKTLHCWALTYCHKQGGVEGTLRKKEVGKVLEDEAGSMSAFASIVYLTCLQMM